VLLPRKEESSVWHGESPIALPPRGLLLLPFLRRRRPLHTFGVFAAFASLRFMLVWCVSVRERKRAQSEGVGEAISRSNERRNQDCSLRLDFAFPHAPDQRPIKEAKDIVTASFFLEIMSSGTLTITVLLVKWLSERDPTDNSGQIHLNKKSRAFSHKIFARSI